MDILDALQDIRARNARNERVGQASDLVSRMTGEEEETEEEKERRLAEEEDEMLVREVFRRCRSPPSLLTCSVVRQFILSIAAHNYHAGSVK